MNHMRYVNITDKIAGVAFKPTIAVDFDGTIFREDKPYPDIGKPFPGVKEALTSLKEKYLIRIYSCRTNGLNSAMWHDTMAEMKAQLDKYQIPYDDIVPWIEGKPFADYYIDNRAVEFHGDWQEVVAKIKL